MEAEIEIIQLSFCVLPCEHQVLLSIKWHHKIQLDIKYIYAFLVLELPLLLYIVLFMFGDYVNRIFILRLESHRMLHLSYYFNAMTAKLQFQSKIKLHIYYHCVPF